MQSTDSKDFEVNLSNFNGPLDVLLDLSKSQKVDLEKISITKLADQFHDFITKVKDLNLELASEYLLMATWLAYLKSKLLLPEDEEDEFKATEVAEKLKLQLKKLELIRLLSDQLLKKNRLGISVRMRGISGGVRTKSNSQYSLSLYELLKSYSTHIMRKNYLSINIPKLPVCTTEQAIQLIKKNIHKIKNWTELNNLIPNNFKKTNKLKKSGIAGFFAASLELSKEGVLTIMQKKSFDKIMIKGKNEG